MIGPTPFSSREFIFDLKMVNAKNINFRLIYVYENSDRDQDIYRLKNTSEIVESLRQHIMPAAKRSMLCHGYYNPRQDENVDGKIHVIQGNKIPDIR